MSKRSIFKTRRPRLARLVAATAALGALATGAGATASAAPRMEPSAAVRPAAIFCWKEYDFTRSGNTVVASAFKDCTDYDVPQPLSVSIKKWYYDEWGYSGWITAASGVGVVTANCNPYWPTTFRHSITLEQIYC